MRWGIPSLGAVLLGAVVAVAGASAQLPAWLPPRAAEGLAQQLDERMRGVLEPSDAAEPGDNPGLDRARQIIGTMASVLTGWGVEGTVERAPEFAGFKIVPAGDPYLDTMARYQVCNALLFLQLQDPAFEGDLNARVTSVLGLSAVTLAVFSLQEPFVAAGGDPAVIEAHLSGPALDPALQAIQTDPSARAKAESACRPVVLALVEPVLP